MLIQGVSPDVPRTYAALVEQGDVPLTTLYHHIHRQLAKEFDCDEWTVRNIAKRARGAEKETFDPFSSKALQQRPQPG